MSNNQLQPQAPAPAPPPSTAPYVSVPIPPPPTASSALNGITRSPTCDLQPLPPPPTASANPVAQRPSRNLASMAEATPKLDNDCLPPSACLRWPPGPAAPHIAGCACPHSSPPALSTPEERMASH
ncbi:hypothetical protein BJ912DRAFT_1058803 [Pholiota molesta]|nr:hypothetical protein BJ912DRAFT_1058803 [Pholiota molesta]